MLRRSLAIDLYAWNICSFIHKFEWYNHIQIGSLAESSIDHHNPQSRQFNGKGNEKKKTENFFEEMLQPIN